MQTFLDHAAHLHDERVMKGERGPELFPRPLFEESPMQQREKIYEYTLRRLKVAQDFFLMESWLNLGLIIKATEIT